MDFLNNLKDNSILIIPSNIKDKVLDYFDKSPRLVDVKITDFNELKKELLFDYNNETINHVMTNYDLNYGVAKNYINNLYYLDKDTYKAEKYNLLYKIRKDLEDHNLLIKDGLYNDFLKSKSNIYVYGYDYINKFNNYLLSIIENITGKKVNKISKEYKDIEHTVSHYKTIEDEVYALAENISELVNNGTSLDKIYIANYSDDYYFTMHKIFRLYSIPYFIKSETALYDTVIGHYFIDNLSSDLEGLLNSIRVKYDVDNNEYNKNIYSKLVNLINTYYWCDDITSVKELLTEEMRNKKISSKHYDKEIQTTDLLDNIFEEDEHVFLIGFNLNSIPHTKKDEDYLDDKIKTDVMTTSVEENKINKEIYFKVIKNIKNLYISYKDKGITGNYYPSYLIDNKWLKVKDGDIDVSKYSNNYNKLIYADRLDNLIKFNTKDELLPILNNNYDIPYMTYDNQISDLDMNNTPIKPFSYSNISTYYLCPYMFYLNNYYELSEYEQTMTTFIGSLFHEVMEKCLKDTTLDIDTVYDNYVKDNEDKREFTSKDRFFIEKLRPDVHRIVDNIRKQYSHSKHNNAWYEEGLQFDAIKDLKLNVSKDNIIVKGKVDKCLFMNNDVIVIDYKTGSSTKIRKDLFPYGVDIQLPIYLFLLKNKNDQYTIVGLYLQHILDGYIKESDIEKCDIDKARYNRLKLDGITLDDESKIENFDDTYNDSEIIKSLKKTKNGDWYYYCNTMTYDDQDKLYDLIKTKIEECINAVLEGNFPIKPIDIRNKVEHCKYCSYRDICYLRASDINNIVITKDEDEAFDEEGDYDE